MTDIVALWAGAATIGCAGLTYLYINCRIDRDEARNDIDIVQRAKDALSNRCEVLKGDNLDLQKQVVDATRENGRLKAEIRIRDAAKPKRDANGKFAPKPKPLKPDINLGIKRTPKAKA